MRSEGARPALRDTEWPPGSGITQCMVDTGRYERSPKRIEESAGGTWNKHFHPDWPTSE